MQTFDIQNEIESSESLRIICSYFDDVVNVILSINYKTEGTLNLKELLV